jgi:hypothetical protein
MRDLIVSPLCFALLVVLLNGLVEIIKIIEVILIS